MPKLKKVVDAVVSEASEIKKSLKKKASKIIPKAKKTSKEATAKKATKAKKQKVKAYNVSGKFKVDAEGDVVKISKNLDVQSFKKLAKTGKPGFIVTVTVPAK